MNMRASGLSLLLFLACTGADPAHAPEATSLAVDPVRRGALESDLVVVLARTGSGELDADAAWPLEARLVNRGARPHWVVRSSSGSDVGWREPHVYYTAELETSPGVWRPVPARDDYWRCSRYNHDWHADVMELAPGASIALEYFTDPSLALDFPRSGNVRLYAHYDYSGGRKKSWPWGPRPNSVAALPDELAQGGPFALVSAPLQLAVRVDTSLEIVLLPRRSRIRVGERATFASLFDAWVMNTGSEPMELGSEIFGSGFVVDAKDDGRWSAFVHDLEGPRHLAPGERAPLRPASTSTDAFSYEIPGSVQLRVRYNLARSRRTPWIALDVVP